MSTAKLVGLAPIGKGDAAILNEFRRISRRAADRLAVLSPRQRQVAELVASGMSTKEVARVLSLSPRTVEIHRALIRERLEITSTAQLFELIFEARMFEKVAERAETD